MLRRHQCAATELQQNSTVLHVAMLVRYREADLIGISVICGLHTLQRTDRYLLGTAVVKCDLRYIF